MKNDKKKTTWKETLKTLVPNPPLSKQELKEYNSMLAEGSKRDSEGKIITKEMTERQWQQLMWVDLEKVREKNRKDNSGKLMFEKHWTKMSKEERKLSEKK